MATPPGPTASVTPMSARRNAGPGAVSFAAVTAELDGQVAPRHGRAAHRHRFAVAVASEPTHVSWSWRPPEIHERAEALLAAGANAHAVVADLTDEAQVAHCSPGWRNEGRLDIVVNNAGMTSLGAGQDVNRPSPR
jgi:hypothetical protein